MKSLDNKKNDVYINYACYIFKNKFITFLLLVFVIFYRDFTNQKAFEIILKFSTKKKKKQIKNSSSSLYLLFIIIELEIKQNVFMFMNTLYKIMNYILIEKNQENYFCF